LLKENEHYSGTKVLCWEKSFRVPPKVGVNIVPEKIHQAVILN